MKDLALALIGPEYCPWCEHRPLSLMERLFKANLFRSDQPWYSQIYCKWISFNTWLGIWKLGLKWHIKQHTESKNG